jgi:hypothetical protein
VPHLLNQLQDVRCRRLPHRHAVYYAVTTVYGLYAAVSQLFMIFLALGQLDLLLARLFSDLVANMVTTRLYLETKTYDPLALVDPMPLSGEQQPPQDGDDGFTAGGGYRHHPHHHPMEEEEDAADDPTNVVVAADGKAAPASRASQQQMMRMSAAMELTDSSFGCDREEELMMCAVDDAPLLAHSGGRPP